MANVLSSQHGVYWSVSGAWFCEYIFLLLSITWHSHSYHYHSNLQRLWGDRWKCYQKDPNGIVNPGWPYIPQKLWSCYFTAMPLSALKCSLVTPLCQLNAILTLPCPQNCWEAGPALLPVPKFIHQENSWGTWQLPNSWVSQLYFETSENLCINWDHDVWSFGKFVIHIHTMCCLHGWHPGSYHALQSCRQNITSDFCWLLAIWGWFSTPTTHCSYPTQAEANYLLQCRSWRS